MRKAILYVLAAGAIAGLLAVSAAPSFAKTVAECNADYSANKAAIKASRQTKKAYVSGCRAGTETIPGGAAAAPAPAALAPAAASAPAATRAAGGKTASACNAEYAANMGAIKAGGQTKKAFVAACRAGNETVPTATAPTVAPAASAPRPTPAAMTPKPAPAARTPVAGGFQTDVLAKAHCPGDTVVWVNTRSHVYHFAGTHNYGTTKLGTYMCEADAKGASDRAAENEKHP